MLNDCTTCRWARWEISASGRHRSSVRGRCTFKPVWPALPAVITRHNESVKLPDPSHFGIWLWEPETDCLTWEAKEPDK